MKATLPFHLVLSMALLTGWAWADGNSAPVPPSEIGEPQPTAPHQEYDALFSDILKALPSAQRAQVDSAQGAKTKEKDIPKTDPAAAREAAKAKREKALGELPPEVKARVDKAITELDNRRKEKAAELKELGP